MAQGFVQDTVRVPLYRFLLFNPMGQSRALKRQQVDFEALTDATAGASSTAENTLHSADVPTIQQGDHLLIIASGNYLLASGTLLIRVKIGATSLVVGAGFSVNPGSYRIIVHTVCRNTGAPSIATSAEVVSTPTSGAVTTVDNHRYFEALQAPASLINPTVSVTQTFSVSDASHTVVNKEFSVIRFRSR